MFYSYSDAEGAKAVIDSMRWVILSSMSWGICDKELYNVGSTVYVFFLPDICIQNSP